VAAETDPQALSRWNHLLPSWRGSLRFRIRAAPPDRRGRAVPRRRRGVLHHRPYPAGGWRLLHRLL